MIGSSVNLYRRIVENFPDIKLIASGGITKVDEINELHDIGVYGAIIGKALYEGKIKLYDLTQFMK
ncbi:1-(5-phosphoribosyl)-5-[(5-phosphoribosylamino)methylideneamino] imidazole-4-carboxamide isomerase [subsurface metagenome]